MAITLQVHLQISDGRTVVSPSARTPAIEVSAPYDRDHATGRVSPDAGEPRTWRKSLPEAILQKVQNAMD